MRLLLDLLRKRNERFRRYDTLHSRSHGSCFLFDLLTEIIHLFPGCICWSSKLVVSDPVCCLMGLYAAANSIQGAKELQPLR